MATTTTTTTSSSSSSSSSLLSNQPGTEKETHRWWLFENNRFMCTYCGFFCLLAKDINSHIDSKKCIKSLPTDDDDENMKLRKLKTSWNENFHIGYPLYVKQPYGDWLPGRVTGIVLQENIEDEIEGIKVEYQNGLYEQAAFCHHKSDSIRYRDPIVDADKFQRMVLEALSHRDLCCELCGTYILGPVRTGTMGTVIYKRLCGSCYDKYDNEERSISSWSSSTPSSQSKQQIKKGGDSELAVPSLLDEILLSIKNDLFGKFIISDFFGETHAAVIIRLKKSAYKPGSLLGKIAEIIRTSIADRNLSRRKDIREIEEVLETLCKKKNGKRQLEMCYIDQFEQSESEEVQIKITAAVELLNPKKEKKKDSS